MACWDLNFCSLPPEFYVHNYVLSHPGCPTLCDPMDCSPPFSSTVALHSQES